MTFPIDPGDDPDHVAPMRVYLSRDGKTIDMEPPSGLPRPSLMDRIVFWAIVAAVIAGALVIAALAFWLAMFLLPIAIGAAIVAYLLFRFRLWQAGGRFRPPGGWR